MTTMPKLFAQGKPVKGRLCSFPTSSLHSSFGWNYPSDDKESKSYVCVDKFWSFSHILWTPLLLWSPGLEENILNSEAFGMPWYGDSSSYSDFPSQGTPGEMKTFLCTSTGKISPSSGGEFVIFMLVLFSKIIHHALKLPRTRTQHIP